VQTRNEKGFTLIELLIVIVIIGILAAVAIPRFQGVADKARIGAAEAELATVKQGLGMYQAENDSSSFPVTISDHAGLMAAISGFVQIAGVTDAAFVFVSYARATRDTFVLKAQAKDRNATVVTVTPTDISHP